ncbi:MAG: response regulator transcription factor [Leptolyngbya sp. BL-A-14]
MMYIPKQIPTLSEDAPLLHSTANFVAACQLSARELEVIKLLVKGHSNPAIAAALHLSPNTIKTYVRSIMNKLGVDRRVQVAVIALQLGLV